MTHEELLAEIENAYTYANGESVKMVKALLEIAKGHAPKVSPYSKSLISCQHCMAQKYPCRTIRAIEEELV